MESRKVEQELRAISTRLGDLVEMLQEFNFVDVSTKWRMLEIELAKLQQTHPKAFDLVQEAWADDGFLVVPPWAQGPPTPEGESQ